MLTTLAERLTRTISVARALVGAGRLVDLSGLEDGVGLLCAKTLDMDVADSRDMLAAMIELRAQIDSLTQKINEQRNLASGHDAPAAAPHGMGAH
jgi:thymidine phosphorylase